MTVDEIKDEISNIRNTNDLNDLSDFCKDLRDILKESVMICKEYKITFTRLPKKKLDFGLDKK